MRFSLKLYIYLIPVFLLLSNEAFSQWMKAQVNHDVFMRDSHGPNGHVMMTLKNGRNLLALPIDSNESYIRVWDYQTGKRGFVYKKYLTLYEILPRVELKELSNHGTLKRGGTTLHLENQFKKDINFELDQIPYQLQPYEEITLRIREGEHGIWISRDGAFPFWGSLTLADSAEYVLKINETEEVLVSELYPILSHQDTVLTEYYSVDTVNVTPKVRVDTARIVNNKHPQDLEESKSKIGIRGYVKLNAIYDFNGLSDVDRFVPVEIPVGDERNTIDRGFYMGARQSRLAFYSNIKAKTGYLKIYIEADFAGGSTIQMLFRLRQAYAEYGFLTIGQTWTTFANLEAIPLTVDREGPNSSIAIRQGMVRWEKKVGYTDNEFGVAIETPTTAFSDSIAVDQRQKYPDISSRYKVKYDKGQVQLSGLFRIISHTDINTNHVTNTAGYGIMVSGKQYIENKDNILYFQAVYGKGISRYVRAFRNYSMDAFVNPADNSVFIPQTSGGYLSFEHHWSEKLFSNITGGVTWLENAEWQAEDSYKSSYYGSINSFWFAFDRMQLGVGYIYGIRRNKNDVQGYASRFQMYIRYDI
ncbi:DcaP family trimeric outer membrane transporter [Flammeovirga sp. SJP92]|uniref:DcaP family trimeric outer membrane transporter n=1 Tax=Flammeovirga sp. SJP92 TaxID=1775430 RepID=UPI0007876B88|nr:DcaP family trimeric outer membrane transporter [Flammeovirga sp. SJP92]KXX71380.1 hypothetical protein AVL50_05620 [Flammeovirga sp. SJP92]